MKKVMIMRKELWKLSVVCMVAGLLLITIGAALVGFDFSKLEMKVEINTNKIVFFNE